MHNSFNKLIQKMDRLYWFLYNRTKIRSCSNKRIMKLENYSWRKKTSKRSKTKIRIKLINWTMMMQYSYNQNLYLTKILDNKWWPLKVKSILTGTCKCNLSSLIKMLLVCNRYSSKLMKIGTRMLLEERSYYYIKNW